MFTYLWQGQRCQEGQESLSEEAGAIEHGWTLVIKEDKMQILPSVTNSTTAISMWLCQVFLAGSSTQRPTCRWPQKAILLTSGVCVQHSSGQRFSWWKLLKGLVQNLFARDCLRGDGLSPHASAVWDVLRQCEAWSCVKNVKVSGIQSASLLSTRIAMFWTLILFYHSCMMLQV